MSTEADIVERIEAERTARAADPLRPANPLLAEAKAEIEHLRLSFQNACQEIAVAIAERDAAYDDIRALWATDQSTIRICEHCDAWLTTDEAARVDDISLCPQEAYGGVKFPNEKCFKHRAWLIHEDRKATSALFATDRDGGCDA